MTRNHLAAALTVIGAVFWIPLIYVTFRDNTGRIDGGTASSTHGRDRFTDIAAVIAIIGVVCAIAGALLLC